MYTGLCRSTKRTDLVAVTDWKYIKDHNGHCFEESLLSCCNMTQDDPSKNKKLKLLEILFTHRIQISRCFVANDGYAVLPLSEVDGDKIFMTDVKTNLEGKGFNPLMPAALRVKKSVIARVGSVIYDHEEEEIKDELITKNNWLQDDLDSIFKFPNSSTLKVTFSQTILAKKCTGNGLKAFNISIPIYEIKQETFIPVSCCMRCYNLEDHATRDCPKDPRYKLCSECSSEGHLWHECKEKTNNVLIVTKNIAQWQSGAPKGK